jgi:hypothetical protein
MLALYTFFAPTAEQAGLTPVRPVLRLRRPKVTELLSSICLLCALNAPNSTYFKRELRQKRPITLRNARYFCNGYRKVSFSVNPRHSPIFLSLFFTAPNSCTVLML